MSELQQQVCEQVRASTIWNYKLGFTCEKCEMKWEIEHQIKDNNSSLNNETKLFFCYYVHINISYMLNFKL